MAFPQDMTIPQDITLDYTPEKFYCLHMGSWVRRSVKLSWYNDANKDIKQPWSG